MRFLARSALAVMRVWLCAWLRVTILRPPARLQSTAESSPKGTIQLSLKVGRIRVIPISQAYPVAWTRKLTLLLGLASLPCCLDSLGPEFRRRVVREDGTLNFTEFMQIAPRMRVMARCSPTDKFNFVKGLMKAGEVVAVTGDGTTSISRRCMELA